MLADSTRAAVTGQLRATPPARPARTAYDYCIDEAPPSDRPGAAYKWADIGYNSKSDAEGRVCGHGEKVPCYCATACPETFGGSQGLIAGPCDADEPLKKVGTGGAESRETAPPAPEE